jgi:spermidine/putrescine-binding protein
MHKDPQLVCQQRFLGRAYDPQNEFTVPNSWGTTGLIIRQISERDADRLSDPERPIYRKIAFTWTSR